MATRFSVWIDTPVTGTNVLDYASFASDSQRASGFVSNTVASAIRVNTALRQANLVTSALMNLVAPSSTVDVTSSMTDVQTAIGTYMNNFVKGSGTANKLAVFSDSKTVSAGPRIWVSSSAPTSSDGDNGDIWFVYEA